MGELKSPSEKQSQKATPAKKSQETSNVGESDFLDSRSSTFQLKKFQEAAQDSGRGSGISSLQTKSSNHTGTSRVAQLQDLSDTRIASEQSALIQKKENKTGIPDGLKSGMESVSGLSLNDVSVHRNSDKPAQLQAHAYAQGTDVHLAPGQEKHLPHELGHVVQQKQGRVAPTVQLKGQVPVNDSPSLEKEADTLGTKALKESNSGSSTLKNATVSSNATAQLITKEEEISLRTARPMTKGMKETVGNQMQVNDQIREFDMSGLKKVEPATKGPTLKDQIGEFNMSGLKKVEPATKEPTLKDQIGKFDKSKLKKVESTEGPTKLERAGNFAEENGGRVDTIGAVNTLVSDTMGEIKGDGSFKNKLKNEESEAVASEGVGMDSAAQGIASDVFGGLTKLADLFAKGSKFWQEKNWETGSDLMVSGAETATYILDTLTKYKAMGEVPLLGPAIGLFKSGLEIFRNNKSLTLLREFEEGKKAGLKDDEKLTLQRYVSTLELKIGSGAVDFVLNLAKAVGDFFPPVGTAISIVQGVKGLFEAGYNTWKSYKSGKEKQALSRIAGGSEAELGDAELEKAGALSAKVAKAEPDSLKSSNGTLMDMVNMKFEIDDVKSQIVSATDEAAKTDLKSKESTLTAKLNESITIYNITMRNVDPSAKITYSDVENLKAIHTSVILIYLNKKEDQKSKWERFKSWAGGPLAPMKDEILAELNKAAPEVTDKDIQEISKGKHAAALWKKTQVALEEASKGRSNFTKEELDTKMTEILKRYKVPADQIKQIVRG